MNQREAKQQGFNDGRAYQAKCHRDNVLTQTQYNKDGEHHLNVIARFAHFKTRNLYWQGWIEAWQEPKQPEPVKHFESRFDFCTCEACNARRQPEQIKPELHVCSGCPDGWCATCTPDEQVYSC